MSHVVALETKILDIEALKACCDELGLEFRENQKNYKWYGRSVGDYPLPAGFTENDLGRCEHAIGIKGNHTSYEVGVVKSRDGVGYTMLWDFWSGGNGLQAKVGDGCGKLLTGYAEEVATKALSKSARKVEKWVDELGNTRIRFKVKEQY